jgi:hypothetical protein
MKTLIITTAILISALLVNCKSENKKIDFSSITAKYFDDKNALDPLGATQNGKKYNDQLVFEMTDSLENRN